MKLVDVSSRSSSSRLHAALPALPRPVADRTRHAPVERWVRWAAAEGSLNAMFFAARRFPGFMRWGKPFFRWGSWKFSHYLQDNILPNARWLLGENSTPRQRWEFGQSVVSNFLDFILDVGRSVGQTDEQLLARIASVEGYESYKAARAARKGAIILTAHMGSFEVGIASLRQHEQRVRVLFRRDSFGLFERTRSRLRRQLGVIEECVDDGLETWMRLREALAADEVVLIQGDRVMSGQKGRRVPILGGHMVLPTGPLRLALATGAPIIPTFSVRDPDGRIRLFNEPPIWVSDDETFESGLDAIRTALEKYLRRFPDQWLMIHRAWCEDAEATGG